MCSAQGSNLYTFDESVYVKSVFKAVFAYHVEQENILVAALHIFQVATVLISSRLWSYDLSYDIHNDDDIMTTNRNVRSCCVANVYKLSKQSMKIKT